MTVRAALPTLVVFLNTAGACDFFRELKSADSAGTDTDAPDGDDTDAGPCTLEDDDACLDQDTVQACSLETGEISTHDCMVVCGAFVNFTCIDVGTGQHACWCVLPGQQKVYSCTELESCLKTCGSDATTACADQCFARTITSTIRLYGAVVSCARAACEPSCKQEPTSCAACLANAMAGGSGCTLERAVCDGDENDEPGP